MTMMDKAECLSAPSRFLRYFYAEQGFTTLTELGALRKEAQPIKVHVGTADNGDEFLVCTDEPVREDITLKPG